MSRISKFSDVHLTYSRIPGFPNRLLPIHRWLPFVLRPAIHYPYPPSEVQLREDVSYLHVLLVFPVRRPSILEPHFEEWEGRVRRDLATCSCDGLVRNRLGYVCFSVNVPRLCVSHSNPLNAFNL